MSYDMDAARVLRGRFVELHLEDIARPSQYEGRVFVGVDSAGGRYLAHWLDSFGAAASIPHAVGEQRGDTLILRFAYSSATFRDTFVYHRREDRWRFLIEAEDPAAPGGWRTFGDYDVRRR